MPSVGASQWCSETTTIPPGRRRGASRRPSAPVPARAPGRWRSSRRRRRRRGSAARACPRTVRARAAPARSARRGRRPPRRSRRRSAEGVGEVAGTTADVEHGPPSQVGAAGGAADRVVGDSRRRSARGRSARRRKAETARPSGAAARGSVGRHRAARRRGQSWRDLPRTASSRTSGARRHDAVQASRPLRVVPAQLARHQPPRGRLAPRSTSRPSRPAWPRAGTRVTPVRTAAYPGRSATRSVDGVRFVRRGVELASTCALVGAAATASVARRRRRRAERRAVPSARCGTGGRSSTSSTTSTASSGASSSARWSRGSAGRSSPGWRRWSTAARRYVAVWRLDPGRAGGPRHRRRSA